MSKRKLLLADDSITIQKVVNLTFADEGIEVISVGDGDSAMRKFDEFMPDLVMADVNMPGINGYEVCRIIKQTEETRNIPVILLVGSFEPFDEAEAKEAGADDYLTKPFQSIRQLVNKVTDLLNRREIAPVEQPEESKPAPTVDSFADTLEFENREDQTQEFGDAGMDDEMIETSPAQNYGDDSEADYQRETTIDYAKTQPLNAEDLKGFNIVPGDETERESRHAEETPESYQETEDTAEFQQPFEESAEESVPTSEPPSFDEEARKLGYYSPAEETENQNEYSFQETENFNEYSSREESFEQQQPDNLSETEPQVDYALPTDEAEFEKELTDAETLEPDVSYAPEEPREADFSQADEEAEAAQNEEEPQETVETSETPMSESDFAEAIQPPTAVEEADETTATRETETEEIEGKTEEAEEPQAESQFETVGETEEPETEMQTAASFDEETPAAESSEEEAATMESDLPETAESEQTAETEETREPEMIDETPISSTTAEAPPLDFADDDLLDLPPLVEETGIRPQPKSAPLVPEVVAPEQQTIEPESKITVTKTVAESEIALSFPPELIEAIAQKVADKISANTMNEVLPQIADLVVQKLAEREKK